MINTKFSYEAGFEIIFINSIKFDYELGRYPPIFFFFQKLTASISIGMWFREWSFSTFKGTALTDSTTGEDMFILNKNNYKKKLLVITEQSISLTLFILNKKKNHLESPFITSNRFLSQSISNCPRIAQTFDLIRGVEGGGDF